MADANTTLAVPLDMNHLARMLPSMVALQDHGRMVMAFLPTSTFGYLHPMFPAGVETIGQNDVIRVHFDGRKPWNGRDLIVVRPPPFAWKPVTLSINY